MVDRLVMLNGLLEKEKQELIGRLALAEQVKVVMPDGTTRSIPLLHNGYVNLIGTSTLDCPTFVAATLSPKFRKMNLTTMDLRGVWSYRRTGELPKGVRWGKGRADIIKKVAHGFEAVDLYLGEKPQPGDLLVHRIPAKPNGKVLIVKSYDDNQMIAHVAEPSSDGTRLIEYDFPLASENANGTNKSLRPGLANLRLLPTDNSACKYSSTPTPAKAIKESRR